MTRLFLSCPSPLVWCWARTWRQARTGADSPPALQPRPASPNTDRPSCLVQNSHNNKLSVPGLGPGLPGRGRGAPVRCRAFLYFSSLRPPSLYPQIITSQRIFSYPLILAFSHNTAILLTRLGMPYSILILHHQSYQI